MYIHAHESKQTFRAIRVIASSTRFRSIATDSIQYSDQIVQTEEVAILVIAQLPLSTMVDHTFALIGGSSGHGFGKVNHPNSCPLTVVDDQQATSNYFVMLEKGGFLKKFSQRFELVNDGCQNFILAIDWRAVRINVEKGSQNLCHVHFTFDLAQTLVFVQFGSILAEIQIENRVDIKQNKFTLYPSILKPRLDDELSCSRNCMYLSLVTLRLACSSTVNASGLILTILSYKSGLNFWFATSSSRKVREPILMSMTEAFLKLYSKSSSSRK